MHHASSRIDLLISIAQNVSHGQDGSLLVDTEWAVVAAANSRLCCWSLNEQGVNRTIEQEGTFARVGLKKGWKGRDVYLGHGRLKGVGVMDRLIGRKEGNSSSRSSGSDAEIEIVILRHLASRSRRTCGLGILVDLPFDFQCNRLRYCENREVYHSMLVIHFLIATVDRFLHIAI